MGNSYSSRRQTVTGGILITLAFAGSPVLALHSGGLPTLAPSQNRPDSASNAGPHGAFVAAEGGNTGITPTGPDQAKTPAAKVNPADPKTTAKLELCKAHFKAADANGDGVLDAGEIAQYNSAIRSSEEPTLSDSDRLNESEFIKACLGGTDHE